MMRTSSLLVLSLLLVLAFVSSAPVEKRSADEKLQVAKRDQEMIIFGNQQNDPRVMKKKSDPDMNAIDENNNVDKQGYIKVVPANTDTEENVAVESEEADNTENNAAEAAEEELPPIKQQIPENNQEEEEEEEATDATEPEGDADSVEEELKGIMSDSKEPEVEPETPGSVEEAPEVPAQQTISETEETEADNEIPEESAEESKEVEEPKEPQETELIPAETEDSNPLMDLYYYMLENEKSNDEPSARDLYYDLGYYPYRRRRSSRRTRAVTEGDMTRNELRRSKRIKRDLLDGDDEYYYPYGDEGYSPEMTEEDIYQLLEPKYEDEVETLLNMYQQAPEVPEYEPYEPYPIEDVYPEIYEEEEEEEVPQYVPSKRQMLSSMPGLKKRYFYPFSREPQTHWGAFVPEKRDYDQTYRRLLALASALSDESPYYQVYRKK